jgi:hypothetical protein
MRRVAEKRRHPRFDGKGIWARLKVDGALGEAVVQNVSLGGALVHTRSRCEAGKNVMLELRGAQRDLRLVGRIVGVARSGSARIRFNPSSQRHAEELDALIRGLPADSTFSSCATDPEAFEFHEVKLALDDSFDIDVQEPEYEA